MRGVSTVASCRQLEACVTGFDHERADLRAASPCAAGCCSGSRGCTLNSTLGRSTATVAMCRSATRVRRRRGAACGDQRRRRARVRADPSRHGNVPLAPGLGVRDPAYFGFSTMRGVSSDVATTSAPHFCRRRPFPVVPSHGGPLGDRAHLSRHSQLREVFVEHQHIARRWFSEIP